jgi:hypothetical protein
MTSEYIGNRPKGIISTTRVWFHISPTSKHLLICSFFKERFYWSVAQFLHQNILEERSGRYQKFIVAVIESGRKIWRLSVRYSLHPGRRSVLNINTRGKGWTGWRTSTSIETIQGYRYIARNCPIAVCTAVPVALSISLGEREREKRIDLTLRYIVTRGQSSKSREFTNRLSSDPYCYIFQVKFTFALVITYWFI